MARINATIWLEVTLEANIPTATKHAPTRNNPMYDVMVAPSSIIPTGSPSACTV